MRDAAGVSIGREWMVGASRCPNSAAWLLACRGGTVADATSRISAAAESVNGASLSALLGSVSSGQLDLAVVQMLDGDTARLLSGQVVANLREADRAHATCLRALGERLVQDAPSFASRNTIDEVARCYLRQRNRLLAKLREVGESSASEFREIQLEVPDAPQGEEAVTTLFGAGNISRGSTARTHFELGYILRAEGGDVGYSIADPEVLREVATALER